MGEVVQAENKIRKTVGVINTVLNNVLIYFIVLNKNFTKSFKNNYFTVIFNHEIISKVDHKHLNHDVDFLKGIIPTVENLTVVFWKILENNFPNGKLHSIRLYETENSFVDYFGK